MFQICHISLGVAHLQQNFAQNWFNPSEVKWFLRNVELTTEAVDGHRFVTKRCSASELARGRWSLRADLGSVPRFSCAQKHSALDCSAINFRLTLREERTCTFNFCPAAIIKSFGCAKKACGGLRIFDRDAKCSLLSNPMTRAPISRRVPALIVPSAVTKARLKRRLVWLPCSTVTALLLAWLSWRPPTLQSFLGRSQRSPWCALA